MNGQTTNPVTSQVTAMQDEQKLVLKYALQGQGALGRHVLEGANALCTTCLKGHGAQLSLTVSGFGGHLQSKAQGTMTNNNQENLNKCNI